MRLIPLLFINLLLLSLPNLALPNGPTTPNQQSSPPLLTCPEISQLKLNPISRRWGDKHKAWRSYTDSFTPSLKQFLGAQWQGVKVGSVFCLYRGEKMTFDVSLQYHGLVAEPTTGNWSKNLGGYRNCISKDLNQCGFLPAPKKNTDNDIYQDLDSLKSMQKQQNAF